MVISSSGWCRLEGHVTASLAAAAVAEAENAAAAAEYQDSRSDTDDDNYVCHGHCSGKRAER